MIDEVDFQFRSSIPLDAKLEMVPGIGGKFRREKFVTGMEGFPAKFCISIARSSHAVLSALTR